MLDSLLARARSLRFRLLLWNAAAVALTGILVLLVLREAVRFTLIADLDEVLREDIQEIKLHFAGPRPVRWRQIQNELDLRAEGHDFHRWFVRFYDSQNQPAWSSRNTPELPRPTPQQMRQQTFTWNNYRLSYAAFQTPTAEASAVCVGCSQKYVAREMASLDRLALGTGFFVLLVSPLVGHLLTRRVIQPLAQMIGTTARLHPGEFGERLPLRGTGDELDSLAKTINGLLDRIANYLRQKHDFLANAAHDLRTPLAAIRTGAEVGLQTPRSGEEYRELLGLVVDQSSSLQTLMCQLLLLAESDADRLQTDREPVALDRVVAQVVEMFSGAAEERGVALHCSPLPRAAVAGNRHHLRQVVGNLLENAIKFTAASDAPQHSVTVELSLDEHANLVRLAVADNGIGISPDDLPHIFDRFYRADKARTREGVDSGTGLGLSICQAIVDAHRGQISVTSRPQAGSTFIVSLPLYRGDDTRAGE